MLEYIDELGQIYSENDINKLAKEQKLSFNDIVKSKSLSVKKQKPSVENRIGAKTSIVNLAKEGIETPSKEEGYKPSKKVLKPLVSGVEDFGAKITEGTAQKSFMEYGQSPKYKQQQLAKKEKAKKEILQEQQKIDSTSAYRTSKAKEQISFDNRYSVGAADIQEGQETATIERLNKKLNQLGIQVEENTFWGTFNFKPIEAKPVEFTGIEAQGTIGTDFDPKDFKGINDYINKFGDKNYTTKVQDRVTKNTPNYISRITPVNLNPVEREEEAKKNLIQKFEGINQASKATTSSMGFGGAATDITSKDFEDNTEFELYKEWKKTGSLGKLDNDKVLELDKKRKEDYIKVASSEFSRTLPEEQRKDLAIVTQQKVNQVRYATEEFKTNVDKYIVVKNEFDSEASAYKSNPTESERLRLQNKYIKLQDQQQALQDKQLELEIDTNATNEVLLPAVKSFGANYNRFSQLTTAAKSAITNVAVGLQDISAYGTAAILGTTQKEVMKNDTFGFVHRAAELNEKQKAKYTYGLLETQFRNLFELASRKEGVTGTVLLQLLEARLDNTVYRLGIAKTRRSARQMVSHKHIVVNGVPTNIPSFTLRPGDFITVKGSSKEIELIQNNVKSKSDVRNFGWVEFNPDTMTGKFLAYPEAEQIPENINVQLIVELYSK